MHSINPTHFENIPAFPDPDKNGEAHLVHAIIETPARRRHKFALDPKYGAFMLKATLAEGLDWPYEYGFIPQTLADDGDPLDVLFLVDEPTFPGCLVKARLLGIVHLEKNGEENDRVLTCAQRVDGIAQTTDPYERISDVPPETIESLCRFLVEYSEEEGNKIVFKGVDGRKKARKAIEAAMEQFKRKRA